MVVNIMIFGRLMMGEMMGIVVNHHPEKGFS